MLHSKQLDQLLPALAKAQTAFPTIPKNQTVTVYTKRGSYDFAYADLGSILAAVTPALRAEGLMLAWGLALGTGGVRLTTRLWHVSSGQWIGCAVDLDACDTLQGLGSAISYLKRYSVVGLLALTPEDDDDGSAASGHHLQRQTVARPTTPETPPVTNGDPRPRTIPLDTGLPCGGLSIEALKPGQLSMLLSKTASLVHADGDTWVPLLAALQAERARRLAPGHIVPVQAPVPTGDVPGAGPDSRPGCRQVF